MFGVIHTWKVKADRRAEHDALMKATLKAERERCPEVLFNVTLGPAADGTCAEVQLYASETAHQRFTERIQREDAELQRLWASYSEHCEADSFRTWRFESADFLGESFVRPSLSWGGARDTVSRSEGKLRGKVALVTGAGQGNGRGIARAFAESGASIFVVDLHRERAEDAARELGELGQPCVAWAADISQEEQVQAMVSAAVRQLGGLDILVNNAGIFPFKPIEQFTSAEFDRVMAVNLKGPWLCAKYAFPEIRRRGGGAIINISSVSGHHGGAAPGGSVYDSSKGGLRQLTTSLATELGPHRIRVNAIAPGVIVTEGTGGRRLLESEAARKDAERTPLRRLGFPDDVGRAAVFLASDDASFVTGITLILDGGATAQW
ncbi:MAG: SDR family oxidoreductase [Planctomycetes bacterium]|nr:SDR family oxidoreductase [Planctomycetota bacterium]